MGTVPPPDLPSPMMIHHAECTGPIDGNLQGGYRRGRRRLVPPAGCACRMVVPRCRHVPAMRGGNRRRPSTPAAVGTAVGVRGLPVATKVSNTQGPAEIQAQRRPP